MQKRQFTRIHFDRKVRLVFEKTAYEHSKIKDLSLSGMFVFGLFDQVEGDECRLVLTQKGASTLLSMDANAKVVWTSDDGLAIQFTSMNYDSYMFLQTTLLYEAEDPLLIGLELPDECPFTILDVAEAEQQSPELSKKITISFSQGNREYYE